MLNKPRVEIQSPLSSEARSQLNVCVCVCMWTAALSFCVFYKKKTARTENETRDYAGVSEWVQEWPFLKQKSVWHELIQSELGNPACET